MTVPWFWFYLDGPGYDWLNKYMVRDCVPVSVAIKNLKKMVNKEQTFLPFKDLGIWGESFMPDSYVISLIKRVAYDV